MSKRHLRKIYQKIRVINTWYFFGLFVIFLIVGVLAVRQNNVKSIELRDAVIKADEQNKDVEGALRQLREHMYSHMNSGLSNDALKQPIQLKYRYERLVEAEKQKSGDSQQVYADAQKYCEERFGQGALRDGRVPCVQEYVSQHSGGQVSQIPDSLYKFDFVSPRWSPDLAGWSLLLSGVFLALFLIRFLTERWFKSELKNL